MAEDPLCAVTVRFEVLPEFAEAFRKAVIENANDTLRSEAGCRAFEVCDGADGTTVFLYELYDNRAAFDLHLATPHFKSFNERSQGWVADKQVGIFTNRLTGLAKS